MFDINLEEKDRIVQRMFTSIAEHYDLNNSLLSFGLHHYWKRFASEKAKVKEGERYLDLCAGTGDIAMLLANKVGEKGLVIGLDLNYRMLCVGKRKLARYGHDERVLLVLGNAESLTFPDKVFDAVTVGFGIRNVSNINKAFSEIYRVIKPGGRAVCLEFSRPTNGLLRWLYDLYSFKILPKVGKMVAGDDTGVYQYLPDSIRKFPDQERLAETIRQAGFSQVEYTNLSGGIVAVHVGIR